MGKIVASYLLKVHLHAPDDDEQELIAKAGGRAPEAPTNEAVKDAVIDGLADVVLGGEVTVSLIERTDD